MKEQEQSVWKSVVEVIGEVTLEIGIWALYVLCTQVLWNSTIVVMFSLSAISYFQAFQLLILFDVAASFSRRLSKTYSRQ
jgi:hypothetical protein